MRAQQNTAVDMMGEVSVDCAGKGELLTERSWRNIVVKSSGSTLLWVSANSAFLKVAR